MSHSSQAHLPPSLFESETAFFPPNPITDPWGERYNLPTFSSKIYQAKISQIHQSHGSKPMESLISLPRGLPMGRHTGRHARAFQKARVRWENGEALARRRHQCRWANQVLDSAPCLKGKWLVQLGGT